MKVHPLLVLLLAAALFGGNGPATASPLYTLNDAANGVSATASFQPVSGGFLMTVTNTESNTPDSGHAISQIQFTIGGSRMGMPTAFIELNGTVTNFAGSTSFMDFKPPTSAQHWPFTMASGGRVQLFDVAGSIGGQPNHLIVASGSTPNASLTSTHLPSFIGPVNFYFADTMVPSDLNISDITSCSFAFGTQPEVPLEGGSGATTGGDPSAPEPASITLLGVTGAVTLLGMAWRRRRTRTANLAA